MTRLTRVMVTPIVLSVMTAGLVLLGAPVRAGADAPPEVRIGDVALSEGNGTQMAKAKVVVSVAHPSASPWCLELYSPHGTATPGDDYKATTKLVKLPPGKTSVLFSVGVVGDTVAEPDETFFVKLLRVRAPVGSKCLGNDPVVSAPNPMPSGTVTILDDDPSPAHTVLLGHVAVPEGNGVAKTKADVPIRLSTPFSSSMLCVAYSMSGGTATGAPRNTIHDSNHDYQIKTGLFAKIPAGKLVSKLTVLVLGDDTAEADETVTLTVDRVVLPTGGKCLATGADAGVAVAGSPAVVTIVDDDA